VGGGFNLFTYLNLKPFPEFHPLPEFWRPHNQSSTTLIRISIRRITPRKTPRKPAIGLRFLARVMLPTTILAKQTGTPIKAKADIPIKSRPL
jgi:hypothetical protein